MSAIMSSSLLSTIECTRGLVNPFTNVKAQDQTSHDLLNFRRIGEEEYLIRISYFTLRNASVNGPNRRRTLQTFSTKKVNRKRVSQLERDQRLVLTAIKKKMLFSKKVGKPIDKPGEQLLEYPLSICDNEGVPLKGQKSYYTKSLEGRYKHSPSPLITSYLPVGWTPECSIIEGMFLINTTSLQSHRTMAEYAQSLLRRFIVSQFSKGGNEVHVIFDNPGRLWNTPKYFEQKRQDSIAKVSPDHTCSDLTTSTVVQHKKWRENHINCRKCKRTVVKFVGNFFLQNAASYLSGNQTLYIAGASDDDITDTAWFVRHQSQPQPDPTFTCAAEETDTRLWYHVKKTHSNKILIMSPDTGVYMIGLPLDGTKQKDIILQISTYSAQELRFLNLTTMICLLHNDPDLARIGNKILPKVMQTIYVATGCDYTSFFSQIGKATFLRYYFQYASFIIAGIDSIPGTLADVSLYDGSYKLGYLAFVRLVGTVYFKKHSSGFVTDSPSIHFSKFIDHT